ncbi:MAG TPA: DUF4865 family protein [Dyella sp.]|nr:DUF4865 family protein [Dyella sp.]
MPAMQYEITLPADYDMAVIRRRIAEKGHLLDGFPGLGFKALLYASGDDTVLPGGTNRYAPFYLWRDGEGMNAFLGGAGFAALARDFGRPAVQTWSVWQASLQGDLSAAVCASREIVPIPEDAWMEGWRERETAAADAAVSEGALAAVTAFEPAGWTLVRLRLWPDLRAGLTNHAARLYRVGHVSQGAIAP